MTIPESLKNEVENVLDQEICKVRSVSGGSINQAAQIRIKDSQTYFLKWNSSAAADMFCKEQKGLKLLQSAKSGLRVPEVIDTGSTPDEIDFIIIEYLPKGSAGSGSNRRFGEGLAALHQNTADQYGLNHHNFIGRLPQSNSYHNNWIDFFVDERLKPQLKMARDSNKLSSDIVKYFERLYSKLPNILVDEPASLLHGDLWSGNYFFDKKGNPTIYDPAVYYGNREIELAFTHLFGGFSTAFYQAYGHIFPLQAGFNNRKDIYNLYPLLVHTNLFGASYARQVESIVRQF